MTPLERIDLTQKLYDASLNDFKPRYTSDTNFSPTYFVITKDNIVKWTKAATQTTFSNVLYTIICTCRHYQYYGYRIDIDVTSIINSEGSLVSNIQLLNWTLTEIDLWASHYDNTRLVLGARFKQSDQLSEIPDLILKFEKPRPFQDLWNYFIEFDSNCDTIKEGELYFKYLLQKDQSLQANLTLEEYKAELSRSNDTINNYKTLLTEIESLVSKANGR